MIGKSRGFAEVGFVVMWSSGFIGAGLLLVGAFLLQRRLPGLREIAVQSVVGLLAQGVYLTGVVGAVEFGVTAGTSALVAALQPLLAAALAGPVLGERVSRQQWSGLAVGLVGVTLVVGGDAGVGGDVPLWAYAMPFVGMAGLVAATLVERKENLQKSTLQASANANPKAGSEEADAETPLDVALAIQCAASALLFAALAPFWGGLEPAGGLHFWAAVAWFVVFSTFGGYGFYWLNLKLSSVARVSSLIYLTPPTTMVWAYLMFGERVGLLAVVGLVICFGGVLLANRGA